MSHAWTLWIWTFQAGFDLCAWFFITMLIRERRGR
jgi:hypothetical protein